MAAAPCAQQGSRPRPASSPHVVALGDATVKVPTDRPEAARRQRGCRAAGKTFTATRPGGAGLPSRSWSAQCSVVRRVADTSRTTITRGAPRAANVAAHVRNRGRLATHHGLAPGVHPGYRNLGRGEGLSLIHISEPTRLLSISYAVFCLKKK